MSANKFVFFLLIGILVVLLFTFYNSLPERELFTAGLFDIFIDIFNAVVSFFIPHPILDPNITPPSLREGNVCMPIGGGIGGTHGYYCAASGNPADAECAFDEDCFKATHNVCDSELPPFVCMSLPGYGFDECSSDSDCYTSSNSVNVCAKGSNDVFYCTTVPRWSPNDGRVDECLQDSDCQQQLKFFK